MFNTNFERRTMFKDKINALIAKQNSKPSKKKIEKVGIGSWWLRMPLIPAPRDRGGGSPCV